MCQLVDDKHLSDAIIIKIYGETNNDAINREREIIFAQIAHAVGSCAELLAIFSNGHILKFVSARILKWKDLWNPQIYRYYFFVSFCRYQTLIYFILHIYTGYTPVFVCGWVKQLKVYNLLSTTLHDGDLVSLITFERTVLDQAVSCFNGKNWSLVFQSVIYLYFKNIRSK